MAGMVNIRSPSTSVKPALFFTRSSPFPVYSSTIKPLMMGFRNRATHVFKRFGQDETVILYQASVCLTSGFKMEIVFWTLSWSIPSVQFGGAKIWEKTQLELTFQTKSKYLMGSYGNQVSIHTYTSKWPAPFIIINTSHEWHSEKFMFLEQLVNRFGQEVSINICGIS